MGDRIRYAVIPRPGAPVEVREVAAPAPAPGEVHLAVELSEVCGTDVHLQAGRLDGVPYPLIPGHVSIGRVSAVRGDVRDVHGRAVREGDRATFLDVHGTCGACWHCLVAKASTRCPHRKVYGITYGEADGLVGGWSERVVLKPGTRVIPAPDVDARAFMAGGCGLPTALHAVERADVRLGDTVLVLGAGPVGLSAAILARMRGALSVLVVGAPAGRLEAARAAGATDVLDFTAVDADARNAWILERTGGRGADVVIEATGAPVAVVQAMQEVRDAGTVVVVGQYTDHGDVPFNPHVDLNRKHVDVRGCWGSDYGHFHRAVAILSDPERAAPWRTLDLVDYGLDDAQRALDDVAAGRVVKALIDPRR
jgi:L-iditol 2-dehydrogenase